jgi:hypothetical protein
MSRHLSMVEVQSDGTTCTLTIRCDSCEGGVYRFAAAHLQTLAKVLPKICEEHGIELDEGSLEARVFDEANPETRGKAQAFYDEFVRRRGRK